MCPYPSVDHTDHRNFMDDGLYRHIIEEIRRNGNASTICFSLHNEPLLDPKFPDRVRHAKELLGRNMRIMTVTNGSPMTPELIEELAASGIDTVDVSIDAFHRATYQKIRQGLNFQRVVENTISLIKRMGPHRVEVSFLRQRENEGEEDAFARFWREHGIRVKFKAPTNRAGTLDSYLRIKKPHPALWKKVAYPLLNRLIPACQLPFSMMTILWNGRVITCGEDWHLRDTVGDISKQPLEEIWNGEKINHYRYLLRTHQARKSLVCSDCSLSENYWKI
jgi:radical SAM protein with 4Fe4S-binding SPASM domain